MSLANIAYKLLPSRWAEDSRLVQGARGQPAQLDRVQRNILDTSARQIIINCHRQWGKSSISSILCLHRALFYPRSLSLIVAPSLRQSGENFRKVLGSLELLDNAPELTEDTHLSLQLTNGSRIVSLPGGGEGATLRGYSGPDLIIEDEASRCADGLYQALRPMMLSNPSGRIILASTPAGQRGHFYRIWTEESDWLKIFVPASRNPRLSPEILARERLRGDLYYRQELECEFLPAENAVFSHELIERMVCDAVLPLWSDSVEVPVSSGASSSWRGMVRTDIEPLNLEGDDENDTDDV